MQIKRFIVYALVYLVIVGALVYLFEGGSYELHLQFSFLGSDTAYALNLPVAVWMILPPAILTLFCVLHMAYHGFKFYAFKRKISHDEKFYRELGKEILLGLDTNKDFKTNFYKIPSQIARILSPWDRYKDANIEGEELQNVLDIMRTVKNGEVADLKKFKLPKDNPLFIKNELNKIANLDGYYLETLKKPMGDQGEIVREARKKLINLGSFADIKKFAPEPDEKEIMTLIARFAKDEINLSNDEILELLNSDKISKDSFSISVAMLKSAYSSASKTNAKRRRKHTSIYCLSLRCSSARRRFWQALKQANIKISAPCYISDKTAKTSRPIYFSSTRIADRFFKKAAFSSSARGLFRSAA